MNRTPAMDIEDGAAEGLKKLNPKLYELISVGISRDKLSPKQIDKYIHLRFGLRKGHPVRDMCYLASLSLKRKAEVAK